MERASRLIAGAMSGTSADGVDGAVVKIDGRGVEMTARLVAHRHIPYDLNLRRQIFQIRRQGSAKLSELAKLGSEISLAYAQCVNKLLEELGLKPGDICAIAVHGQTLFHDPPQTIQWLDPSLLAARTGCAVISDFRRADCAAGGQGAPLVPFADYVLFRHPTKNRVLLNIGGIANLTWLKSGGSLQDVIAFDTGPGNCISDHYARESNLPQGVDLNGALADQGDADFQLAFLAIRLWKRVFEPPPKSTDTGEMLSAYDRAMHTLEKNAMPLKNHLASACLTTALGVDLALHHLPSRPDEILISGGGVHNKRLVRELSQVIKLPILTTDEFGWSSQAKEAVAFALLGAATLDGLASNVPSATGASRAVVLGSITPKP
ncbi:MAG TPA: anhydro-N-acetylmuramic acid kinase [Tepidisphaeraceae bacterium]|nr:anhydro-N-acetylmuramic acid kinase [Tepidisphaeraceae bacterium]